MARNFELKPRGNRVFRPGAKLWRNGLKASRRPLHKHEVTDNDDTSVAGTFFFLGLLVAGLYGIYLLLEPFIDPIIFGLLIGAICYPLHGQILKWLKGRELLAAFASSTMVFLLVLLPVIFCLSVVVQETRDLTEVGIQKLNQEREQFETLGYQGWIKEKGWSENKVVGWVNDQMDDRSEEEVAEWTKKGVTKLNEVMKNLYDQALAVLGYAGGFLFDFGIMLLVVFYVFLDGARLLSYLLHLSPLPSSEERIILERLKDVGSTALLGTFLTALAQSFLAMIGLFFTGLPVLFLSMMVGITSMIPVVGTTLVTIPVVLWLYFTGSPGGAIFFTIWSIVCFGGSDYLLRPLFMKGKEPLPTAFILFAIMGGVAVFGLKGFIYGPMIFGFVAVLLWIYDERNRRMLETMDHR